MEKTGFGLELMPKIGDFYRHGFTRMLVRLEKVNDHILNNFWCTNLKTNGRNKILITEPYWKILSAIEVAKIKLDGLI